MRSSIKRHKRPRSKNARDMAKAHDPDLRKIWTELYAQVQAGTISKSDMYIKYNKAVTELLQNEDWNKHYSSMAYHQEPGRAPPTDEETHEEDFSRPQTLQFVSRG